MRIQAKGKIVRSFPLHVQQLVVEKFEEDTCQRIREHQREQSWKILTGTHVGTTRQIRQINVWLFTVSCKIWWDALSLPLKSTIC